MDPLAVALDSNDPSVRSSAAEAQNRAEREAQLDDCAGADAYMISEDPSSGEVSTPSFLVRLGNVPSFDDF